jgi:hypothetical protein
MIVAFMAMSSGGGLMVTTEEDVEPQPGAPSRPAALAAPTDGVASRVLPVVVEPSTQLTDGQVVGISGSGFTPRATLGAVLCSAGAAGGGGVAFCELAHYDNFEASSEGTFSDEYRLRRFITTPTEGRVDCAEATDRCLLAVGNIRDYDESGGSFISYAGAADPPPPQLAVTPSDGLADGQVISVTGTGLRAAPDGRLRQCPAGGEAGVTCVPLVAELDGPAVGGRLAVTVRVVRHLGSGDGRVDCAAPPGCVLTSTEYAGRLAIVPLGFDAAAQPVPPPPLPPAAAPEVTTTVLPGPPGSAVPETSAPPPQPTTTEVVGPGEATGSLDDLDLRLELDDSTLGPGGTTDGFLVVENRTGRTILDTACGLAGYDFGIVPSSLTTVVEVECGPDGLAMPPGYADRRPIGTFVARDGEHEPLEPGAYEAVVRFHDPEIAQRSALVTVTDP